MSAGDSFQHRPARVALAPREAFYALGRFAAEDAARSGEARLPAGGQPLLSGRIARRLAEFGRRHPDLPGLAFLTAAVRIGIDRLGFDPDAWVLELARGALGDAAATPERMLPHCERVVRELFAQRLCGGQPPAGRLEAFATQGGRTAIGHAIRTLLANRLLAAGDRVAAGTSVLLPYVEFPQLAAYGLEVVEVVADRTDGWQFPDLQLERLADQSVKAFFLVNPLGPDLLAIRRRTVRRIEAIVRGARPDLLIVSDEGFGSYVAGFRSLAADLPASVLSAYSFDRQLGAGGWRLGVAMLHHDNAFDCAIAELPDGVRREVAERYAGAGGGELRFIDRMVIESQPVGLRQAAGLSWPQQTQLSLFALYQLTDGGESFIRATSSLATGRLADLYRGIGSPSPAGPRAAVPYFALVSVLDLARARHGDTFAVWLRRTGQSVDFLTALGVPAAVLLPAGTANPDGWTIRLSLADSSAEDYAAIGRRLVAAVDEVHAARRARRRSRARTGSSPVGDAREAVPGPPSLPADREETST